MFKIRISKIIDILFFVFIFLNILMFDLKIFGVIKLRYLIFAFILFLTIYIHPYGKRLKTKSWYFVSGVLYIVIFLLTYSIIYMDNNFTNAMWFINPYLFLLIIPTLQVLFDEYGIKRYIRYIAISTFSMIIYILILYVIFFVDSKLAYLIASKHTLISLSQYGNYPRFTIRTIIFVPILFMYVAFYVKSFFLRFSLYIFLLSFIIIARTYGVFLGLAGICFGYLFIKKRYLSIILLILVGVLAFSFLFKPWYSSLNKYKKYSIDVKVEQIQNTFRDLSLRTFLFGDGIGAKLKNLDKRKIEDDYVIEVAPVMLFRIGGIIGTLLISYIYFYPALLGLFRCRTTGDPNLYFIVLSQICLLTSSLSNPYIWSGGVGILFISMIITYLSLNRMHHE